MKINDSQKEILQRKLATLWPLPRRCSICKNDDWLISDTIYEVREFQVLSFSQPASTIPFVTVLCAKCGHQIFFNAIQIGLVESDKKQVAHE